MSCEQIDKKKFLILHFFSISITLLSTDIYLPCLPKINEYFRISGEISQLIISFFFLGSFLGSLFYGPLSDIFGRRKAMILGLSIFTVGACLCVFSSNVSFLIFSRFIQGIGMGAINVVGWTVVNDIYKGKTAAKAMSWFGSLLSCVIACAPILGGELAYWFGWHSNFVFIAVLSVLLLTLKLKFFPETLPENKRSSLSLYDTITTIRNILVFRPFISYVVLFPLFCIGEWCCLIIMPFFLQHNLGFNSEQSGYIIGGMVSTYIFSAALAPKIINKYGLNMTIKAGIYLALIGGILLLYVSFIYPDNLYLIIFSQVFYFFGGALIFGPSSSIALQSIETGRGTASTIRSSLFLLFSTIGSFIGYLFVSDFYLLTVSLCMIASTTGIFIIYKWFCIDAFEVWSEPDTLRKKLA